MHLLAKLWGFFLTAKLISSALFFLQLYFPISFFSFPLYFEKTQFHFLKNLIISK